MRLLPPETTPDAGVLLTTRGMRAFVDGLVSVVLAPYLVLLGFDGVHVGAIVAGTLFGSAALTLFVGLRGQRIPRLLLLQLVAVVMILTGLGFGAFSSFWALFAVAVVGTLNPSAGDVSVFLPTEQALLPSTVSDRERTALYGRYSLVGFTVAAFGSLAAGVPSWLHRHGWVDAVPAYRGVFLVYALTGVAVLLSYRRLSPAIDTGASSRQAVSAQTRRIVVRLAALFCVDAFGGGFVVQSLLALWLFRKFGLSVGVAGAIFFWAGLLSGLSALAAVRIARRIGLVRTMVFTHLPANALLIATPFMPNVGLAVTCLLARSALSQMDVPARTSYVMAIVPPAERAAAASITNVPRSLASVLPPLAAGWLLDHSRFGWPLVIGGLLKAAYDLLLLRQFGEIRPPEEMPAVAVPR
jgi:MFS family permease